MHRSAPHPNIKNTPTGGHKIVNKIIQQSAIVFLLFIKKGKKEAKKVSVVLA